MMDCTHENSRSIGGCKDGCCDEHECPNCGWTFYSEVPQ